MAVVLCSRQKQTHTRRGTYARQTARGAELQLSTAAIWIKVNIDPRSQKAAAIRHLHGSAALNAACILKITRSWTGPSVVFKVTTQHDRISSQWVSIAN